MYAMYLAFRHNESTSNILADNKLSMGARGGFCNMWRVTVAVVVFFTVIPQTRCAITVCLFYFSTLQFLVLAKCRNWMSR